MVYLGDRITIALTLEGQYDDGYYFSPFRHSWSWGLSSYLLLILFDSWLARPLNSLGNLRSQGRWPETSSWEGVDSQRSARKVTIRKARSNLSVTSNFSKEILESPVRAALS